MLCIILLNESNPRMIDSQNWGQAGRTSTFIKINKLNNRCMFVCLYVCFFSLFLIPTFMYLVNVVNILYALLSAYFACRYYTLFCVRDAVVTKQEHKGGYNFFFPLLLFRNPSSIAILLLLLLLLLLQYYLLLTWFSLFFKTQEDCEGMENFLKNHP